MVSYAHYNTTLFDVIGQVKDPGFLSLGRTATWSRAVHVALVALVVLVRLPTRGEMPLRSIEVALVSLPSLPRSVEPERHSAPPQTQPVRPQSVTKPVPPPKPVARPVEREKASVPPPRPSPPAPVLEKASAPKAEVPSPRNPSSDIMRDVLRDIALPPEAPRIGELSPSQKVAEATSIEPKPKLSPEKPRPNLDSILKKLQVPELSPLPQVQPDEPPASKMAESRSSLTDELKRELDQELKKLAPQVSPKPVEPPKEMKPPAATAKIPTARTPDVELQVPGMKSGASAYLARVQQLISGNWDAPPVDISARALTVTIRFRLHRDGAISAVTVEESSGNEYYDLAGKRAVLRTGQLPPFPSDVKESHFDAHFTFAIGRSAG